MKILILHNDNLPDSISQLEVNEELEITLILLTEPPTDRKDFDTFVSESLSEMNLEKYDIIVLPLNFTETYLEFTGLRVAAHIRLTHDWNCLSMPILFWGSDKVEDVLRFNILGEILNTYNVYYTQEKGADALLKKFKHIEGHRLKDISTSSIQYKHFLERMKLIPAPSNYTTHHSIANEWAIMRWAKMISTKGRSFTTSNAAFNNILYYKYLKVVSGISNDFTPNYNDKHPISGKTKNLSGKRIVLIDDEASKGWEQVLRFVIEDLSGGRLTTYPIPKCKFKTKDELITEITDFIDTDYLNPDGCSDCFILDLRLHDDDFNESIKYTEISGHIIAKHIKDANINPYRQIVLFTASNKVWNLQYAIKTIKASGYAIKETPEQNLSRADSQSLFSEFCTAVYHACSKSYLQGLFRDLELLRSVFNYSKGELDLLYQCVELLDIDDEDNNDSIIKACVLSLCTFLEVFCKDRFSLTTDAISRSPSYKNYWSKRIFIKDDDCSVICFNNKQVGLMPGYYELVSNDDKKKINDKAYILVPLYMFYNLSDRELTLVNELKDARNAVAHQGKTNYTKEKLLIIFKEVIMEILKIERAKTPL